MAQPNEITIRVSSPILFIDEDSASVEPSGQDSFQSLTVVSRKAHSSDRVNTSSDTSPMPSLSPKAPIAKEEQSSENISQPSQSKHFELTIRGEHTVINIQTIGKSATLNKQGNNNQDLVEFINQSVQQIFQTPRQDEIEKALENAGFQNEGTQRKFTKKGTWKMLSRSAKAMQNQYQSFRDREERYPSIVLLQEPLEEEKSSENNYPKMVVDGQTQCEGMEKPKYEYRSRSMLSLLNHSPSAINELNLEKYNIAIERGFLERERKCLEEEREGLEKGKNTLEKEKRTLERSKLFLFQDQHILQEKKQVLQEEKASISEKPEKSGVTLSKKENLCLEFEKQLLEDEKKIMNEEQSILHREKEIIEKEKGILGGERNVLEEEKAILGKERVVLEKQQSIVSEMVGRPEGSGEGRHSQNMSDDVLSEIEDVFEEACNFSNKYCRGHHHPPQRAAPPGQVAHCSTNNHSPCSLSSPYPMYIPVYSLPRPYLSSYRPCVSGGPLKKSKSIQTQTEKCQEQPPPLPTSGIPTAPESDLSGLPFGLLSGIFPRMVITSMNSIQHGAEERADNARNTLIREITPEEPVIVGPNKVKRKGPKKLMKVAPKKNVGSAKCLQLPPPDLTLKAVSSTTQVNSSGTFDDLETEESGIQTLTSETFPKDDTSGGSDETISVETIHFGYSDDFYSNEAIFPGKSVDSGTQMQKPKTDKLPLTNVGYDMYEKLTQLTLERDLPPAAPMQEGNGPIDNNLSCGSNINLHVNLHVREGGVQLTLPGNVSMCVTPFTCEGNFNKLDTYPSHISASELTPEGRGEGRKTLVKRADLWHTDSSVKTQDKTQYNQNGAISLTLPNGPEVKLSLSSKESSSVHLSDTDKSVNIFVGDSKKCTCEAKVGTDDQTVAEGAQSTKPAPRSQLSPRTADLLEALRQKLELSESERKVVSFGKADGQVQKPWGGNSMDHPLNGLFLVRHLESPSMATKQKTTRPKPPRIDTPTREYLCEECLTTMRLYEDDFQSVQNIVDKFENMDRYGCK